MTIPAEALAAAGFIAVHLLAGRLHGLAGVPRNVWLSAAGGISVAYVFVHIFPDLAAAQNTLAAASAGTLPWLEHHAYVLAMAGLLVFYGVEQLIRRSAAGRDAQDASGPTLTGQRVFWLHVLTFSFYNALIGYLLVHREDDSLRGLAFYAFAMGLHFVVNDIGLERDHRDSYRGKGRWVLAAAVALGFVGGVVVGPSDAGADLLFAFLAGGIILNVLKEELPAERKSRFLPFLAAATGYAVVLLLVG